MAFSASTKVSIFGGGPAGVAAAFELTATPELRERYEVTLYTLGWRLGGKCASGRNADFGQRIEEHGLHVWFGFYDNAFGLIQRAYAELGRPPGAPFARWTDAFKPSDEIILCERWHDDWVTHRFSPPHNPLIPGESLEVSFWDAVHVATGWLHSLWARVRAEHPDIARAPRGGRAPHPAAAAAADALDRLEAGAAASVAMGVERLLELGHKLATARIRHAEHAAGAGHEPLLCRLLRDFRDWLWRDVVERRIDRASLRLTFYCVDFVTAVICGIVEDELVERGFATINDQELRGWLASHGISQLTLDHAPFVRGYYDLAFAYENGDKTRPNLAAGKALQDLIRIAFTYKGAMLWKMQAGMGDAVFSPLYEVLRNRGVRFEFFSRLDRLALSDDRATVQEVEVSRQALLEHGEYQPVVPVKGLACWPSEPRWSQLQDGDALRASGVNFEDPAAPAAGPPLTLRRGRDFDAVVLAVSLGSLEPICDEILADPGNDDFRAMMANSHSVATQAFQLWLNCPLHEVGWAFAEDATLSSYVEPLDTYATMNQLLAPEDWPPDDRVCNIAYFCGVLSDVEHETQSAADDRARRKALAYLRGDLGYLWPHAESPRGVRWEDLVDPRHRVGEERFYAQYWRANLLGSERYVTTYAGTVNYRLRADQSGYENLFLAGDWTRNGIDGGSVEAAVTSGMLAARAISGSPATIPGTSGWLAGDGRQVRVKG